MSEIKTFKSPELSYSVATVQHSQGYYTKKPLKNGASTHTIKVGEPTETSFVFDPLTYNLAEFVLHYNVEIETGVPMLGYFAHEYMDVVPIQTIELKGQATGNVLARIDHAYAYCASVCKSESTGSHFKTMGPGDAIQPSNSESKDNKYYDSADKKFANFNDIRYMGIEGVDLAAGGVVAPNSERYFRFSDIFKNTLLGLDKTWYSPEPLELTITWLDAGAWYIISDLIDDPTSDQRVAPYGLLLSNMYVNMYHEKSGSIIDKQCRELVNQGLTMFTPTVVSDVRLVPGMQENVSLKYELKSGIGKKLSKVYMVPMRVAPAITSRFDHHNVNGARITQYQTRFNNDIIQNASVDCKNGRDDWLLNSKRFRDSAFANYQVYRLSWIMLDDFSGCANDSKNSLPYQEDSLYVGKDITPRDQYEIELTFGITGYRICTYFVGGRILSISPSGIEVV